MLPRTIRPFLPLPILLLVLCIMPGCEEPNAPDDPWNRQVYHHIRPSWSPDGGTIAFTATIHDTLGIYAVDTLGGSLRRLHAGDAVGVTWSPDGQWICFSQGRNLYKRDIVSDSLVQLTSSGNDVRPAWSKDGKNIAFVRGSDIWVLDMATAAERQLSVWGDFPSWHPNGNEVLFLRLASLSPFRYFQYQFQAVPLDATSTRLVVTLLSYSACSFSSISPAGNEIVLSRTADASFAEILRAPIANGAPEVLVSNGGDFPCWSPNGGRIVYTRTQEGDGGLWIMNADGRGKRRLTTPLGEETLK